MFVKCVLRGCSLGRVWVKRWRWKWKGGDVNLLVKKKNKEEETNSAEMRCSLQ